jgi:hypothetical protein
MFIEMVDSLRCINAHDETWLVAASRRTVDRDIVDGVLGCPICSAEYPIVDGVAQFAGGAAADENAEPGRPAAASDPAQITPDDSMRLAAMLALSEPGGFVLLAGEWGSHAHALHELTAVQVMVLNPVAGIMSGGGVSLLTARERLPLAAGSARAVALDGGAGEFLGDALRVVRSRGRVVADAALPVAEQLRELARDESVWVAEAPIAASPPVTLRRAP